MLKTETMHIDSAIVNAAMLEVYYVTKHTCQKAQSANSFYIGCRDFRI